MLRDVQIQIRILYDERNANPITEEGPAQDSTHALTQHMRAFPASDFQIFDTGHSSSEEHDCLNKLQQ